MAETELHDSLLLQLREEHLLSAQQAEQTVEEPHDSRARGTAEQSNGRAAGGGHRLHSLGDDAGLAAIAAGSAPLRRGRTAGG